MDYTAELNKTLNELENDHNLPRDRWSEAIESKVRELIKRYRDEHRQKESDR